MGNPMLDEMMAMPIFLGITPDGVNEQQINEDVRHSSINDAQTYFSGRNLYRGPVVQLSGVYNIDALPADRLASVTGLTGDLRDDEFPSEVTFNDVVNNKGKWDYRNQITSKHHDAVVNELKKTKEQVEVLTSQVNALMELLPKKFSTMVRE